jgi:hypothetical protein
MRLKVESDGTAQGTRVMSEDGEMLHGVRSVTWSAAVGGAKPEVTLVLSGVPVTMTPDVIGDEGVT